MDEQSVHHLLKGTPSRSPVRDSEARHELGLNVVPFLPAKCFCLTLYLNFLEMLALVSVTFPPDLREEVVLAGDLANRRNRTAGHGVRTADNGRRITPPSGFDHFPGR